MISRQGRRIRRNGVLAVVGVGIGLPAALVVAAETVTYTYDARGRLVRVVHSGGVNNNVATDYGYDKADNRTVKTTTGAPK